MASSQQSDSDDTPRKADLTTSKGKLESSLQRKASISRAPSLDVRSLSRQSSGLDFMKPRRESQEIFEMVIFLTKETQTDWEWAERESKLASTTVKEPPKQDDRDPDRCETPPPIVTPLDHVRTAGVQVNFDLTETVSIAVQAFEEDTDDAIPEPFLELSITKSETRIMDTPVVRKHGGATPIQEPWPPRTPLFGQPVMMYEERQFEATDSSRREESDNLSEPDTDINLEEITASNGLLPQLGLPNSLSMKKDSAENTPAKSRKELEQILAETVTLTKEALDSQGDSTFANLVCEFCQKPLRPFPTAQEQKSLASSELYCCDDYRKFVEFVLAASNSFEEEMKSKLTESRSDTTASESQNSKSEKTHEQLKNKLTKSNKSNKSHDDEKKHRMELERQMAMLEKARKMRETQARDGKQVKVINFQLSKYRSYEEGMVVLPPDFHLSEIEQFQHRKIQAALAEQVARQQKRQLAEADTVGPAIEYSSGDASARYHGEQSYLLDGGVPVIKKYDDKITTFLILLADGTSTVFYPSGNIAITVSLFNGIRTFTAFDDRPISQTRILAIFMSSGFGTVYTKSGSIRLSLTPAAGFEANPDDGSKRRRWTWAEMAAGSHIHAPPFQCIFYHLNSYLSVRIGDSHDWTLTFFYKQYRCRFSIMAFTPYDVIDSRVFDLSDIRLVRLNKFKSQFVDSHTKLKALLREINYMIGLIPTNSSSISWSLESKTPRSARKPSANKAQKERPSTITARLPRQTVLPPIINQPVVEVD